MFSFFFKARGDYAVCLDNTYSHMTSKLISLFILTFQSNLMQKKIVEDQMLNETHSAVRVSDQGLKFLAVGLARSYRLGKGSTHAPKLKNLHNTSSNPPTSSASTLSR